MFFEGSRFSSQAIFMPVTLPGARLPRAAACGACEGSCERGRLATALRFAS